MCQSTVHKNCASTSFYVEPVTLIFFAIYVYKENVYCILDVKYMLDGLWDEKTRFLWYGDGGVRCTLVSDIIGWYTRQTWC